ncbi:HDOD domain-containing protein [Undibacterium sp. CY18W]|uniref:HDOD domain-containing protein n=1 Tax=Undibacterium hunanense TaxID=2762292 RepID=A0ABR6ZY14_9BURK|nr:HDOD domain-containing protein [Undibacterium hunanense]MBC3920761.1 HDOD domain-containing protein [Undibacterium hunanense]
MLKRLFGLAADSGSAAGNDHAQHAGSLTTGAAGKMDGLAEEAPNDLNWKPAFDVDARFFPWLLGDYGKSFGHDLEKPLLMALEKVCRSEFAGSSLIPRVPSVLPQLLKSLRNENVSGDELARHIAKDVSLVAELIAEVNSSYYSTGDKISSLDNAVRLLGINGLRMLVARSAFRPLIQLQSGHLTKQVAPVIWQQSEYCALACRLLAQERGLDSFHAYLAGLLQNVGLIIAFRTMDQSMQYQRMPLSTEFRLSFLHMAQSLSFRVAQQWDFPDTVTAALQAQINSDSSTPSQQKLQDLGLVVRQASELSKLRLLVNDDIVSQQDKELQWAAASNIQSCFAALQLQQRDNQSA